MAVRVNAKPYLIAGAKLKMAKTAMRRSFNRRLNNAARPALREVIRKGAEGAPARGGLRNLVASQTQTEVTRTGEMGLRAVLNNRRVALGRLNDGRIYHPLFGLRGHWFGQAVPAGRFSEGFDEAEQRVDREVAKVLDDVTGSL